jgi:XRE family transcriptional regulator, regulator of sulfur utilization
VKERRDILIPFKIDAGFFFRNMSTNFYYTRKSLFPFDERLHCEIFIIELLPTCEHLSSPHKSGVIEHVIVVDGTLDVLLNGAWRTLRKGEGLRFNANQHHGYRNTTPKNACFHNIIHYPVKFSSNISSD